LNPFRKVSLNIKIGALLLLTLSGCLFLSGWLTVLRLRQAAYASASDTLIKETAVAALAVERLPVDQDGNPLDASELIKRIWGETRLSNSDRLEELKLYRVDMAGMTALPLACWGTSQGRCQPSALTLEMRRVLDSGLPQHWQGCADSAGRCLVACVPVASPRKQHWLLMAEMDTERIDQQIGKMVDTVIAALVEKSPAPISRTRASRIPPPTVPWVPPSGLTIIRAPAERGAEPVRVRTVARTKFSRFSRRSTMLLNRFMT